MTEELLKLLDQHQKIIEYIGKRVNESEKEQVKINNEVTKRLRELLSIIKIIDKKIETK